MISPTSITTGRRSSIQQLSDLGARIVGFKRKEIIIAEGEPPKDIGVILSRAVQIVQVDYFGNRSIIAGIGPSEIFREAFACAGIASISR